MTLRPGASWVCALKTRGAMPSLASGTLAKFRKDLSLQRAA